MKMTIGIIGTGNFATVLVRLFSHAQNCTVLQSSTSKKVDHRGIFPLEQVLSADVVFLCIPISVLENFLSSHMNLIQANGLIVDVCSVKQQPVKWMRESLPKTCDILATHPLFGPQSTRRGTQFAGLHMILWPVRIRNQIRLQAVLEIFSKQQIILHTMNPITHDKLMAKTQAVSFLFGHLGHKLKLHATDFDTKGFSALLVNQAIVETDSHQLCVDLFRHNFYAQMMLAAFLKEAQAFYFYQTKLKGGGA